MVATPQPAAESDHAAAIAFDAIAKRCASARAEVLRFAPPSPSAAPRLSGLEARAITRMVFLPIKGILQSHEWHCIPDAA